MDKNQIKAFTLIEILVWISLIWIIFLWTSMINFERLSDRQKAQTLSNEVYSSIERERNNSIMWKWYWTGLLNATSSVINISTSGSWILFTDYYLWTWKIWTSSWVNFIPYTSINKIVCYKADLSQNQTLTNLSIIMQWDNMTFSWCLFSWNTWSIVDITTKYKEFSDTIRINSISWMMQRL